MKISQIKIQIQLWIIYITENSIIYVTQNSNEGGNENIVDPK